MEPSGGLRDPRSTEELLSLFNLCEISRNFSASREVRTDGAGNNARAPTRDMLLLLGAVKSTRHRWGGGYGCVSGWLGRQVECTIAVLKQC